MKLIKGFAMVLVAGALFLGSGTVDTSAATKVSKIKWSNVRSKRTMYRGTSKKYTVKITPTKAKSRKLQWYSSNKKVATVTSKGTVTAKKNGTVYITCRVKAQKTKKVVCKVTVKTKKVSKVSLSSSQAVIQKGKTYVRKATVTPTYAYDRRVTYKSSNTKVATVSSYGTVTGKSEGYATITATSRDGSKKSDSYKVRVIGNITKDSADFVAHRGLSSQAPENTVKAFELAGQAGFWGAECDVRMTSDEKFVINHDTTFKRMCGVDKRPEDMTLDEIKQLKIISGNNYSKYKSDSNATTVATLEEYLEVCKKYGMVPVIEIKMEYTESGRAKNSSMQQIVNADMRTLNTAVKAVMGTSDYKFIAFDLETIVQMREVLNTDQLPNVTLEHVVNYPSTGSINYYRNRGIGLDCQYQNISTNQIKQFQDGGVNVNLWTVDDPGQVWDYIKAKVNYITTNKKFW